MPSSLVEEMKPEGGVSASVSPIEYLFHRRIEFHPARKPFSTISSSGGEFYLETLNPSSDSHRPASCGAPTGAVSSSSPSVKRSDDGEFNEHVLDPELSFRITFRRIGAGLANLGNTCFLNSVLQCLTYTEPFAAYLKSGKHKSSCHTTGFCVMCALQNHVVAALQSTGRIVSPLHLVKNLRCISRNFRNSRQEDAHEYMVNLLESMHKCCLPSGVPSESPSAYERSLVHKIFGGHLRSQVKCTQCSYCSNKFDPFLDLSLEIVKADSLRKALMRFTAVEQLDGGQKQYYCQRCKEKVRALKQLTVHKAPHVLTIHLKRFGSNVPGQKIDKKVEFGPTLDLKPFVSDPHEGDLKYTLYGVLVHAGWSTHSGHYYCFVRTSSGMWHSLDDNQVFQVSEKTVLEQKAYMLFYVRDRRSFVVKRPVDVAQKENITDNAPGNKVIPLADLGLKRAIQNVFMERKADTSEHDAGMSKRDATLNGRSISVIVAPSEDPVVKEAPALLNNGDNMWKQAPFLQNNGHVILKEASVLQTNGYALSQGSQQRALSNGPTKLVFFQNSLLKRPHVVTTTTKQAVAEDLVQSAQLKENGISTTSCTNDAPFIPESTQTSHGKNHLPNGCNSEVKGVGILVALPNKCGFSNRAEKLLTETGMHEKGDASNGSACSNDTPCKMVCDYESEKIGPSILSSQPSAINGFVQQNVAPEDERYSSNLQFQHAGRSPLKLGENGLASLSKKPSTSNACVGKEALAISDTKCSVGDCYSTDLKQKKLAKCSLVRSMPFGRKRLFLASLSLRKNKKHKRMRKRRVDSVTITKSKAMEDLNLDDQVTSTSEGVRMVGVDSMRSRNKCTHSGSNKENGIQLVKDANYCNGGSVNTNDRDVGERSGKTSVMLSTFEQPKRSLCSAVSQYDARETDPHEKRETDSREKSSIQHSIMSLLMRGLEETTVARWDDAELPSSQINGLNGVRNSSIGYVLDEWDEEYDRGKRKKVKQSSNSCGGLNLFQETATIKAQQKMKAKMAQIRSGNQPFRI